MNDFFFHSLNVIAVAFLDLSSLCNLSDPFNYIISDSGIFINHLVCWITCPFLRIKPISTLGHTYEGASENMNNWIWMIYLRKKLPTSHFPSLSEDRLNHLCMAFLSPWSHCHRHTLRHLKVQL